MRNTKSLTALGEIPVEMLSDMGSTPIISTIWYRKDRLDGLSFLLDRVDKQDFAGISKAEVSEIYLHVSQPTRKRLAFFC